MITIVFMVIAKTVIYSNDGSCPINSNKAIINGYIYLTEGLIPIPVLIRFRSHCDTTCNTALFVRWGRFRKVNNVFLTIITKTESIFRCEIFKYDYSNEYYREVLSCGGIYFAVQRSKI